MIYDQMQIQIKRDQIYVDTRTENTLPRILSIFDLIHPSFIFRLIQIIVVLALSFLMAFGLLLALVLRMVTIWQHRNEILVALVRRTNQDEVGTGTPSEHDGNHKHITFQA